jgi:hypothetical protein
MVRLAVLVGLFVGSHAVAAEQTVAKLQVGGQDLVVTRAGGKDGGVQIRVKAGKNPPLVVYQGGGDEDGAGDKDVRGVTAAAFDLPGGKKGVRVDLTYHPPDKPKKDEQTDTFVVSLAAKPLAVAEVRTRLGHDRTKTCREYEETALVAEGDDLVGITTVRLDPALGDDDLPIDKTCKSPKGAKKKIYKWSGTKFEDPDAPAPVKAKPAAEEEAD